MKFNGIFSTGSFNHHPAIFIAWTAKVWSGVHKKHPTSTAALSQGCVEEVGRMFPRWAKARILLVVDQFVVVDGIPGPVSWVHSGRWDDWVGWFTFRFGRGKCMGQK
jgi:hypothetical protein